MSGVPRQIGPHRAHEPDHFLQRGVVAQLQVVAAGDVKGGADGGKRFRLLYCVNSQVRFQVQVQIEHVRGVAGLFGDNGYHLRRDGIASVG